MSDAGIEKIKQIKTFPALVRYLRDELDWPIETDEIDDLTFDYAPEELGVDAKHAAKIKEIKQLRPLEMHQPWGIFWVNFEKKKLPMVVLRRILGSLVIKRRAAYRKSERPGWHLHDLLFISSFGEEEHRNISFAHFKEDSNPDSHELPVLHVLGWDDQNTIFHFDRVVSKLHSNLRWPDDSSDAEKWRQDWSGAFTDRYGEAISSADELIRKLAGLAAGIRRRVNDVLDAESERGRMRQLFGAMQKLLIHDMNEDGFADMYAQTVAYGLLSARFSRESGELTAQNLVQLTKITNPFLGNLLERLFRLNRGKLHFDIDEVGINDVLDLLRHTNIEAIKAAFSDKNPAEDPVIRFYEGFLKAYDPKQRVKRGVFFTPRPVVSYIVRSVHELLQTEFGLEDGLASTDTWADMKKRFPDLTIPKGAEPGDPFVCILDPATGTGTFLFECIEVIERAMKNKWQKELGCKDWRHPEIMKRWRKYVPKHLLTRLYGYELMMAPYSIAHLKLALKLGETGYQFHDGDRLHIYLTNSLEPPSKYVDSKMADMFATLATESQEVNHIKRGKCFSVIIGNPPYAAASSNQSVLKDGTLTFIGNLIRTYYEVDGKPLGEKNPRWLQDDYVKFMRYGQDCLSKLPCGIIGLITNHGYLVNPTFRGMRQQLMKDFYRLIVYDLHGDSRKKELCPDGTPDGNVFDIQKGVAISILIRNKLKDTHSTSSVEHGEIYGLRDIKYNALLNTCLSDIKWTRLSPQSPFYVFVEQDNNLYNEYLLSWRITDIFPVNNTGVITKRDNLAIHFKPDEVWKTVKLFSSLTEKDAKNEFDLPDDVRDWKITWAQKDIISNGLSRSKIKPIIYRPFDIRYTYYTGNARGFLGWPVEKVMRHLLSNENIGLISARSNKSKNMDHFFVTRYMMETKCGERTTQSCIFPIYLYEDCSILNKDKIRYINYTSVFSTALKKIKDKYEKNATEISKHHIQEISADDVFHFIYAQFYSNNYRKRYEEFIKMDFPRVFLTENVELFFSLSQLGADLVALHLLENDYKHASWQIKGNSPFENYEKEIQFCGEGDNQVKRVGETGKGLCNIINGTGKIYINETQYFVGVPEDVWNYYIGGYQVCYSWLKYRKAKTGNKLRDGRILDNDDIKHFQKMVIALKETIRLMGEIDKVIEKHGGWPGAFITDPKVYEEIRNADPFR